MSENFPEEGAEIAGEPTTEEIIAKLRDLKESGIDFEEEDIEHLQEMDADDAMAYLIIALAEAGQDPDEFLVESGLAEEVQSDEERAEETKNG